LKLLSRESSEKPHGTWVVTKSSEPKSISRAGMRRPKENAPKTALSIL
jgi:hypothetical protein